MKLFVNERHIQHVCVSDNEKKIQRNTTRHDSGRFDFIDECANQPLEMF